MIFARGCAQAWSRAVRMSGRKDKQTSMPVRLLAMDREQAAQNALFEALVGVGIGRSKFQGHVLQEFAATWGHKAA